ncbi:MAG: integrase arm-type DNA-binding domain-containing protein [Woeseia sp.]
MRTKLTQTDVKRATEPGLHNDGGGLYLRVTKAGGKSWIFRWRDRASYKLRDMGLGPVSTVALSTARDRAKECRAIVEAGGDPIAARRHERAEQRAQAGDAMTFDQCAAAYIKAHAPGWKSAKHAGQWQSTLERFASPVMGSLPVQDVTQGHVLRVLEPIWTTKAETASRLRGRIESVLDYASARGLRTGENPARWKGRLDKLLPKPSKVKRAGHHAALAFAKLPAFMRRLGRRKGTAARALEFTIATATRTSEVIAAEWVEIDWQAKVWTIPAGRMKSGREHRVPLSAAAIRALKAQKGAGDTYIWPLDDGHLSAWAMLAVLRRMGRSDITVHGFRSSFRDWAAETTSFPGDVVEMALAHTIRDKAEAAYRRGDLFDKRRKLMAAWARHCAPRR